MVCLWNSVEVGIVIGVYKVRKVGKVDYGGSFVGSVWVWFFFSVYLY